MKGAVALFGLLLWQAGVANGPPVAQPQFMRYVRELKVPPPQRTSSPGTPVPVGSGQACAVLDAAVFPHAQPSLVDLRVFPESGGAVHEVPYAITLSEAVTEETQTARVLNLGTERGKVAFDLEMPQRAYTNVELKIDPTAKDFLVTATVTGMDALGNGAKTTALGTFTLFDLSGQRLSRDTTLPLEESTFRYLHVVMSVVSAPGAKGESGFGPEMVQGAEVPPSRESQIVYTTVAETKVVQTVGRETIARFEVPRRVPLERVEIVPAAGFKGNFSRDVRVTATAEPAPKGEAPAMTDGDGSDVEGDGRAPLPEVVMGTILRVHTTEAGREIRSDELNVPAVLGANLQRTAKVEVAIENGDDQPLPIAAVKLEMRQRELCFDAGTAAAMANGAGLGLYYGDAALGGPVYDYVRLFTAVEKPLAATLGPEEENPAYVPRPAVPQSFTERYPQVLWIALIAMICVLGMVAVRSAKSVGR